MRKAASGWKIAFHIMAGLLTASFGISIGSMKWLKVKRHTLVLPKLPRGLDGLRILHITDLHSGNAAKINLDIWKTVDTLPFDIAVITGDMIIGNKAPGRFRELTPHFDGLAALARRIPTFYVAGNHEYWDLPEMLAFMKRIGITALQDETCAITFNGTTFTIAGTLDFYHYRRKGGYASLHEMMNEASNGFKLVLTHQPQVFRALKRYAPDLVLAGHTHGGQLRLPFCPTLYAPGQGLFPQYGAGLYTDKPSGAKLYVSRGIGTTMFRMRFFNRPEITLFTLRIPPEKE